MDWARFSNPRAIPIDRSVVASLVEQTYQGVSLRLPIEPNEIILSTSRRIRAADGSTIRVPIVVRAVASDEVDFVLGGALGEAKRRGRIGDVWYDKGTGIVIVNVNASKTDEEWSAAVGTRLIDRDLFRVFAHELTHAADIFRARDPSGGPDVPPEVYFNRPAEVRAFMREVVDQSHSACLVVLFDAPTSVASTSMAPVPASRCC